MHLGVFLDAETFEKAESPFPSPIARSAATWRSLLTINFRPREIASSTSYPRNGMGIDVKWGFKPKH